MGHTRKSNLEIFTEAKGTGRCRQKISMPALRADDTMITLVREARAKQEEPLSPDQLKDIFKVKNASIANRSIMYDLILESYQDATIPPNTHKVKKRIYREFRDLTGLSAERTSVAWKEANQVVDKVLDIGLLSNYGATVLTDVISRAYEDLAATKDQIDPETGEIIQKGRDMKDHVKVTYYKTLMEAADMLLNLGVKQKANEINIDKNKIMKQKVDNDAKLGAADVALRIQDMDRPEMEKTALDALFGDKTLLNPIFDKIQSLEIMDADFTEL